ncbi:MAG: glycosyltransferase family 2 protein, partial [Pseudomonadota bacterium]
MTTEQSNKERHQPPKVTIGVPVYNGEAYLAEALDSILGQTFGDFEVIISDNASCDRTEDICRDYASRDPRITYIRQEKNAGAAPNFNLLVSLAKGKYFKWAASDDLIAPEFLASCLEALESNSNASIAMTQTRIVDEAGRELDCQSVSSAFTSPEFNERFAALLPMRACFEVF